MKHEPALLETCVDGSSDLTAQQKRILELEKINEQLSHFAWIAAHDLQEPLRNITSLASLLDQAIATSNSAAIERGTAAIRKAAAGASELVNDILEYSRVSNGQLALDVLDLREQLQLALDNISQPIRETEADIGLQVPSTPFKADASQFARLMQNILSNAIKYRKPGHRPKISISASFSNKKIVLAVADDGIGFEQEFAEFVFHPFSRLNAKAKYPGSGIGLAICKSICDREGWDISVQSQPGRGTTFFITMPALEEDSRTIESEFCSAVKEPRLESDSAS